MFVQRMTGTTAMRLLYRGQLWPSKAFARRIVAYNQKEKVRSSHVLNDLEFAYTPVREKVNDLREYL
jgi:hypothetical protein